MCDVMPTIAEDNISQRSSQFSGEDANFEQLMVSMLDERDKLMDSLREAQERLNDTEIKLTDTEKERDSLQRQINANLPQVCKVKRTHEWLPFFFRFSTIPTDVQKVACTHTGKQYQNRATCGSYSITWAYFLHEYRTHSSASVNRMTVKKFNPVRHSRMALVGGV